jgi:hypothetical protein
MENEIWKDIEGYEGFYQVSNCGNVKSLERIVNSRYKSGRLVKEKILKGRKNRWGYVKIGLNKGSCSHYKTIHRLVAQAFIPNPENKPETNHKNGVKIDNRVENLEWVTKSENAKHAFEIGLRNMLSGENSWNSKLTNDQVREIRSKYVYGKVSITYLAKIYNAGKSTIHHIIERSTWKTI